MCLPFPFRRREPQVVAGADQDNTHESHQGIEQTGRETTPYARMQGVDQSAVKEDTHEIPSPTERPAQAGQTHAQQEQRDIETAYHMQVVPETKPAIPGMDHKSVAPTLPLLGEPQDESGDEDDDQYSSETNTLKNLLESGSDIVGQVIGGSTNTSGVGTQMYDYLRKSMTRIEGVRSTQTFYNDKTLDSEIDDYDDDIDKWDEKLQNLEDKYYDQFSKMESAMAKLQSQQSYLSSLFGSAS